MITAQSGLRRYLPAETFQPLVWLGLFLAFSALPVATVYGTRSSPAVLALACLTLLADEFRRNPRLDRLRALSRGLWAKPMLLPLALMAGLGTASALWSAAPGHSFETALQFAGSVLLGAGWVALVSRFRRQHVLPFLAGGLTVALVALPLELLPPAGIRGVFTDQTLPYEHNRTILQLSVLATLFMALAGLSGSLLWRTWAAALLFGSIAVALLSESQTVLAYWAAFGVVAIAAGWAPRRSLAAIGLAAGMIVVAFPWAFLLWSDAIAGLLAGLLPAGFAEAANVEHRLLIWTEFAGIVSERPFFGWGMEGERALDVPTVLGPSLTVSPHHPHSLALELWTGLGAAGAALAMVVLGGFLRLVARYGEPVAGWATSLFAGTFAVWLISHGAWEHWWLAILPLSLGTLLAVDFYPAEAEPIAPS
jgi:O-antigen ligase